MAKKNKSETKSPITLKLSQENITDPGVIEYLVATGRIPHVLDSFSNPWTKEEEYIPVLIVPPKGAKPKESIRISPFAGVELFQTPDGKEIGYAENFDLKPENVKEIKRRIKITRQIYDTRPFWKKILRLR